MIDDNRNSRFYIYAHIRPDKNEVFYIGKGKGRRAYDGKTGRNRYWKNIVKKNNGLFTVQILAENLIESLAFELEKELIKQFRERGVKLCNITDGGEGSSGYKHHEEHKQKMRVKHSGNNNPMYGRTRENCPAYGKTGINAPSYGRTGDKHPNSKPVLQIDKLTGEIIKVFSCTWEAQRELGINNSNISSCCNGKFKVKSAGGYIWRYL